MPLIQPTNQPAYYVIRSLEIDGITPVGQATGVSNALTVVHAEGEAAFLDAAKAIGSYKPLPAAGAWLEAGQMYGYNNGVVIVRQSHTRTEHTPADVPALFSVYRSGGGVLEWVANEPVLIGTRRTYGGTTYECIQAHTTQTDWTPPNVPSLWRVYVETPPTGAWAYPVAYAVGALVTYLGNTYRCLQAHTSQAGWTPAAVPALWQRV